MKFTRSHHAKFAGTFLALLSLAILSSAFAGNTGHGLDEKLLAEIPAKMQAFVDAGETTGVVTLAARNGEIAFFDAVGNQSIDPDVPMRKNSIFWAASISKPFAAVSIMMLVEEGKLKISDPVEMHIPAFKGMLKTVPDYDIEAREIKLVEPTRPVTIQDILNHTHGIPLSSSAYAAESLKEHVFASARTTLDWDPGSKWRYGSEGIHTAAYLVEMYSGMSYPDFLQKRIFDPLGMKDTYFMRKDVPEDRLVGIYNKDKATQEWNTANDRMVTPKYFRPSGGLYSTAKDMFIWHQAMLNGGQYNGIRLITDESLNQLKTITCGHLAKGGHMDGCYYGLGFQIVRDPTNSKTKMLSPGTYGHGGSGGSTIWIDPTTSVIYILMRNNYGTSNNLIIEAFQQTVSDALLEKRR